MIRAKRIMDLSVVNKDVEIIKGRRQTGLEHSVWGSFSPVKLTIVSFLTCVLYLFKVFVKCQEKGDLEVYPWIHRDFAVRAWLLALLRLLKRIRLIKTIIKTRVYHFSDLFNPTFALLTTYSLWRAFLPSAILQQQHSRWSGHVASWAVTIVDQAEPTPTLFKCPRTSLSHFVTVSPVALYL